MKKVKIFIVEDNPADMALIKDSCLRVNSRITFMEARDGQFAIDELEKLDKKRSVDFPDFILLDLNLPRLDGHEVLEFLKQDDVFQMIPVVIFSSSSSPMDIQGALKANANSYVVKPFQLEEFENAISKIYNYWVTLTTSGFNV
jgi:CheY-like chemotaxis protein